MMWVARECLMGRSGPLHISRGQRLVSELEKFWWPDFRSGCRLLLLRCEICTVLPRDILGNPWRIAAHRAVPVIGLIHPHRAVIPTTAS
jgi:hypothetical protein